MNNLIYYKKVKETLWKEDGILYSDENLILRKPVFEDKNEFLKLQYENAIMPQMFKYEEFKESLWDEHINNENNLMCSIISNQTQEYVGYCGIKNTSAEKWEIAIEILNKWKRQGIGYFSMQKFLDTVANKTGVVEFRIRIASDNYASQALFEKLGAIPNGISEFMIHGEENIKRVEEDNLKYIDDKLVDVAKRIGVEPRKLLSHVLEYLLVWKI